MSKQIVIDIKAILTFFGIVAGLILAFQVKSIILSLFIATIVTLGLTPAVDYLVKKKFPRPFSVLLVFVTALITIASLIALAIVPMLNDTIALINNFPSYIDRISQVPQLEPFVKNFDQKIADQVSGIASSALNTTISAVTGIFFIVTILVFTVYLLMDFENIRKFLINLFPKKSRTEITEVLLQIESKLSLWLRGQISLMIIVGTLSYIGLILLGVPYAMSLAMIAGLLELVPMVGPTMATIPAVIVGFATSPIHGIGVIGLYVLIQQLENNIIVPKVMQKVTGFNPLLTMIAILTGGTLLGIGGALLAVPTTLVLSIILKNYLKKLY